jgi:hypothetical protein
MPRKGECRFCLEEDKVKYLLSPCICSGTGKYVHATCLMKWYLIQPDKGLECAVCKTRLATRRNDAIETIPTAEEIQWFCVTTPFLNLFALNCFVLVINGILSANSPKLEFIFPAYYLIQALVHLFYGAKFLTLLDKVKQQEKYITHWSEPTRLGIVATHIVFLCGVPYTGILTGTAADICLITYFYEHIEVLKEMNEDARIEFCSLSTPSCE